jgi:hypothetical protein
MADAVFYFRGNPPTNDVDDTLLADLSVIAGLLPDQIKRINETLQQAAGFLGPASLRDRIGAVLSDEATARAVSRALRRLDSDDIEAVCRKVDTWRKSGQAEIFDDAKVANLRRNLTALIVTYPALARFEKAERLSSRTGKRLESLSLVCDLRPIFDTTGKGVDGMMPYTRFRIVATGVDGLPCDFEVELTREQVDQLLTTAKRAKKKLTALSELIPVWIPEGLPELPLTRLPQEGGENA